MQTPEASAPALTKRYRSSGLPRTNMVLGCAEVCLKNATKGLKANDYKLNKMMHMFMRNATIQRRRGGGGGSNIEW